MSDARLGLTDAEVHWLRRNTGTNKTATKLVNLYQMIVEKPTDAGFRREFKYELNLWRHKVENGDPVP